MALVNNSASAGSFSAAYIASSHHLMQRSSLAPNLTNLAIISRSICEKFTDAKSA
jgi:hypothetical protein